MPKRYSSREVIKVLQRKGFLLISQRGSHMKFYRHGWHSRTAIVPAGRKEIPRGTFQSILRQAGLTEEDFRAK